MSRESLTQFCNPVSVPVALTWAIQLNSIQFIFLSYLAARITDQLIALKGFLWSPCSNQAQVEAEETHMNDYLLRVLNEKVKKRTSSQYIG